MQSHSVLARKWRPRNFQQMIGQDHILRMLTNALEQERLHHAYLYTGTRGVGKTTLARIFAKCLNCEKGISANPCGECTICQAIDSGRFLDLIEVDAASRTKVEDTREILENVQYAPAQGRFKIYLIDEVHMLSNHSFNALLKTLEEPPAHVKFLLATTDPKRLPITILSRCLQFNLKRVSAAQITQHLEYICRQEQISFEAPALALIAQAADGSVRDALSLLDQSIAYCQENINLADTQQMLGTIDHDAIYRMLDALAEKNGAKLLAEIAALAEFAPNFKHVLDTLLTVLHQINIAQLIPDTNKDSAPIQKLKTLFSPEEIQLYYQIALIGTQDLPLAPHPVMGFEMVMLRMLAFQPQDPKAPTKTQKESHHPVPAVKTAPTQDPVNLDWSQIIEKLQLTGMAQALIANCSLIKIDSARVELALSKTHESMLNKKLLERIEQALGQFLNKTVKLEIKIIEAELNTPAKEQRKILENKQNQATEAIKNDGNVQKIMDLFDATVDLQSVKAI